MAREKIDLLLKALSEEIKKAESIAQKTKKAAQEIAKAAASSPSQSGDREHSKNQAEIAEDFLNNLRIATKQVTESYKLDLPQTVQSACYLKLGFKDGRVEDYFMLENPVKLERIKLISQGSPLGLSLIGKKVGDKFEVKDPPIAGQILEIG